MNRYQLRHCPYLSLRSVNYLADVEVKLQLRSKLIFL